jgi:hypothetical protein
LASVSDGPRGKAGVDTRRLLLQPSWNHRLEKGDRPSPLNLNTAHQQTHFIIRKCVSSSTLAFPDKEMIFIMNTVRCSSANAFHHQEMRFIINTGVS